MWARSTIRVERRALLALTVIVVIVGSVVLTTFAAARRTASSSGRFREATLMPDTFINVESVLGSGALREEVFAKIDALAERPDVEAIAAFSVAAASPELDGEPIGFGAFVPEDERLGTTVAQPIVRAGRVPDPAAAAEVAVNEPMADRLGVGPGDRLRLATIADFGSGDAGPDVEVMVTGVIVGFFDVLNEGPGVYPTPAFLSRYRDEIAVSEGYVMADLADDVDVESFTQAVRALFGGGDDVVVQVFDAETPGVQDAIDTQAAASFIAAAVFAIAAMVVVSQALSRYVHRISHDEPVLVALGMTRRRRLGEAMATLAPVALLGAVLSAAVAVLVSQWTPIGVAGRIEPARGIDLDPVATLGGGLVILAFVIGFGGISWLLARRPRLAPARWGSTVTDRLSPAAAFGMRSALQPARAVAARIGTIGGLTGVVMALLVGGALTQLTTTPDRYGITWDGEVVVNPNDAGAPRPTPAALAAGARELLADPVVTGTALAAYTDGITLDGVAVAAFGIEDDSGFEPSIVRGRPARSPGEVTLGGGTLDTLDVDVGDTVTAAGAGGGSVRLRVVGEALFPVVADNGYDATAGLTLAGFQRLAQEEAEYRHLFRVTPGADVDAVHARHGALGFPGVLDRPTEITNLARLDSYPWAFGAVFVAMSLIAVVHGITSGIRSARHDVALARALGFTRRDVRVLVRWWLLVDTAIALALGALLGVIVSRNGWSVVAREVHVDDTIAVPPAELALVTVIGMAAALALSVPMARSAARDRPAAALRTE